MPGGAQVSKQTSTGVVKCRSNSVKKGGKGPQRRDAQLCGGKLGRLHRGGDT